MYQTSQVIEMQATRQIELIGNPHMKEDSKVPNFSSYKYDKLLIENN